MTATHALPTLALVLLLGACRGAAFSAGPITFVNGAAPEPVVQPVTPGQHETEETDKESEDPIEAPLEIAEQIPQPQTPPKPRITYLAPNVFRPVTGGVNKTWSPQWRSEGKESLRLGFNLIDVEGRK